MPSSVPPAFEVALEKQEKLLSRELILAQLHRIISSRNFIKKRQLSRFLEYIVKTTLDGKALRLKGSVIAEEVFDKTETKNSIGVVRTRASQLRIALQNYYQTEGKQDRIIISLPVGGYKAVFGFNRKQGDTRKQQALAITDPDPKTEAVTFVTIGVGLFTNMSTNPENRYCLFYEPL